MSKKKVPDKNKAIIAKLKLVKTLKEEQPAINGNKSSKVQSSEPELSKDEKLEHDIIELINNAASDGVKPYDIQHILLNLASYNNAAIWATTHNHDCKDGEMLECQQNLVWDTLSCFHTMMAAELQRYNAEQRGEIC